MLDCKLVLGLYKVKTSHICFLRFLFEGSSAGLLYLGILVNLLACHEICLFWSWQICNQERMWKDTRRWLGPNKIFHPAYTTTQVPNQCCVVLWFFKEPPVLCILKTESTNHCCRYFKKSESKNWPVLGIQNPQRMLVFVKEPPTLPNSLTFKIVFGLIPKVISVTSCKCVAHFKAAQHGFPRAARPWEQIDIETCHVLVVAWRRFRPVRNRMPWNMSSETYHPPKLIKFQRAASHTFQCPGSPNPPNISPSKHITFQELCFSPTCPSSMFPHVIPIGAPWPIHDVLDLFNFTLSLCIFSPKLMSSSPFPPHRFT